MVDPRDQAKILSIKIAVAVAVLLADGSINREEQDALRDIVEAWIEEEFPNADHTQRRRLLHEYASQFRHAIQASLMGGLDIALLARELNAVADYATRHATVALCYDIMAADGVAHPEEMNVIRQLSSALDLDPAELERIRDRRIVGLDTGRRPIATANDILGIDDAWDRETVLAFLGREFAKWNDRLTSLPEGRGRQNAQRMLDLIGQAHARFSAEAAADAD